MHELSICKAVLQQVPGVVAPPDATAIGRIGPLAGVGWLVDQRGHVTQKAAAHG
jgi:hypothetical protein